jgi:hypothetical protein
MVVGPDPVRPEVMLGKVEEFPPHLYRRQVEEVPNRLNLDLGQRPVKANERVLKNVIGLLPAAKVRVAVEHLPGQAKQPVAGMIEQGLPGLLLPGSRKVDQVLNLRIGCLCSHKWNPRHGLSRWESSHFIGFSSGIHRPTSCAIAGQERGQKKIFRQRGPFSGRVSHGWKIPAIRTPAEGHTMLNSRVLLLFGIMFVIAGCGGDVKVPPALPETPKQGASAPVSHPDGQKVEVDEREDATIRFYTEVQSNGKTRIVYHGLCTFFYDKNSRSKRYEGKWVNGQLQGTHYFYHRNGKVAASRDFANGKPTGLHKRYDLDGNTLWTIDYTTNRQDAFAYAPTWAFLEQFAFFCRPVAGSSARWRTLNMVSGNDKYGYEWMARIESQRNQHSEQELIDWFGTPVKSPHQSSSERWQYKCSDGIAEIRITDVGEFISISGPDVYSTAPLPKF